MHEIKSKPTRSKPHKVTIKYYDLIKDIVKKHKDVTIATDFFL